MMIDFHSHILPGIDDGSRNIEESILLLNELKGQGIGAVAATPHFYASRRSPQEFLDRRDHAYERLVLSLPGGLPKIFLGGEILYYPGISRMHELDLLCLQGTDLLLLEMPFKTWSEYMLDEILDIARSRQYTLLLAHIERYYFKQTRSIWDSLLQEDVLMQANADFFLGFFQSQRALSLIKQGRIHLLGSDCHNMETRRPRMAEAIETIRRYCGIEVLENMEELGQAILYGR